MRHLAQALFLLLFVMTACTGNGVQANGGDEASDSDSVAAPTIEELMLPDTMYASVSALEYKVELDDSVPHFLKDFDDRYDRIDRVMTFRKNLRRDADFKGSVKGIPDTIEIAWSFDTPYDTARTKFGSWGGGTGWTGQPL